MMNGHGKSDGSVVPEKPPNNAGQPAAEAVEGRGPAKGVQRGVFRSIKRTDAAKPRH